MSMVIGDGSGGSFCFNVAGLSLSLSLSLSLTHTHTHTGVTLAGGAYGMHFEEGTMGPHAQVTGSFISHVQFVNMTKAGMFVDSICAPTASHSLST